MAQNFRMTVHQDSQNNLGALRVDQCMHVGFTGDHGIRDMKWTGTHAECHWRPLGRKQIARES